MPSTFEDQVTALKETPGISHADIEFADRWVTNVTREEQQRVRDWMKQRKTGNAERRNELSDRLHEVTQRANQVYEDASRGARSIPELLRERRLLQTEIAGLEQLIESVEVSEAMIARIEADPAAYMDDFYARFPGLADRRPRLDIALAQDRTNRRIS